MRILISAIMLLALTGCATGTPCRDDAACYCATVANEALLYADFKTKGHTETDVLMHASNVVDRRGRPYPARERERMRAVVNAVYDDFPLNEVEGWCLMERRAGTWYK
jgi:hypothetical protein